jgi:hypothetical protein
MMLSGLNLGSAQAGPGYEVILPTEWPTRPSDLEGLAVAVKDNRVFVKPVFKREDGQQDYPEVEVVVTNTTEIYLDETDRQRPAIVAGRLEFVIRPFDLDQIRPGYILNVWGARRGDRWLAETIIVYVIPTEEAPR